MTFLELLLGVPLFALLIFSWLSPVYLLLTILGSLVRKRLFKLEKEMQLLPRGYQADFILLPVLAAGGAFLGGYGVNIVTSELGGEDSLSDWAASWAVGAVALVASLWFCLTYGVRLAGVAAAEPVNVMRWRQQLRDAGLVVGQAKQVPLSVDQHRSLLVQTRRIKGVGERLASGIIQATGRPWLSEKRAVAALLVASLILNAFLGIVIGIPFLHGLAAGTRYPAGEPPVGWLGVATLLVVLSALTQPLVLRTRRRWWVRAVGADLIKDADDLAKRLLKQSPVAPAPILPAAARVGLCTRLRESLRRRSPTS